MRTATLLILACLGWTGPVMAGELGEILSDALEHPTINARELDRHAAESTLSAETARYFGSGQAMMRFERYEGERIVGPFSLDTFNALPADRQIDRYGVAYRLPVDVFGVIKAARDRAQNDLEAARLIESREKLLKLHQVTGAYVRLQALGRQQAGLVKRHDTLVRRLERVRAELELGKAAKVDLKLADSELARVEADTVRLTGAVREARVQLMEARGHGQAPATDNIHVPAWRGAELGDAIPVQLAGARAEAAEARAREVARSLWPNVTVGGDYFEFDGAGVTPDAWTVSLGVSIPLDMTAHQRRSAAQYRARAAAEDRLAARRETERQLTALKSAYDSAVADAAALRTELEYREQVVELEAEKHRLGAQTLENLLRHERDWLEALFRLADAEARATAAWSAAQVLAGPPVQSYITAVDGP